MFSFGIKPTTLSGKQASIPKNAVSAILAAIVMQRVPFGHNLLCAKPNSPYILEYSVIYLSAFFTSLVCRKGYFPSSNSRASFLGLCFDFPLPKSPSLFKCTYFHSDGISGKLFISSLEQYSISILIFPCFSFVNLPSNASFKIA